MWTGEKDSKTFHVNLYKKKNFHFQKDRALSMKNKKYSDGEAKAKLGGWGFDMLHNYDL